MQPYYERDGIVIYHGDCREVLPTLGPHSCDLIVTDPPYGVAWQSNWRKDAYAPIAGDTDQVVALEGLALALHRLQRYRHVYIFGRYDLSGLPLGSSQELIWDKARTSAGDLTLPWGCQHEYIQFAVYIPARSDRDKGRGRLSARLRRGSVLRYSRLDGNASVHPTEKPVGLLRELIESSSCIGDLVLDPFMGAGSTLLAAQFEARRAIGIELEERYCEVAARRLEQAVLPLAV